MRPRACGSKETTTVADPAGLVAVAPRARTIRSPPMLFTTSEPTSDPGRRLSADPPTSTLASPSFSATAFDPCNPPPSTLSRARAPGDTFVVTGRAAPSAEMAGAEARSQDAPFGLGLGLGPGRGLSSAAQPAVTRARAATNVIVFMVLLTASPG